MGSFATMDLATADELVRLGHEALATADWERARAFFEQAAEIGETAEILDGLGEALQFGGELAQAIELKERAFAEYERRDLRAEAAELARWLAFLHISVRGNVAAANGWMARAESCPEGGRRVRSARVAHRSTGLRGARDASEREQLATAAIAIARRYGDTDLEFDAMALLGDAYVATGRVTEGMTLLDQAMAAVASGEVVRVGPAGEIYCRLLSACERATDVRRAEQWLGAATRFEAWGDFVPPTCRTHYGGILIALGCWEEAERQLLAAIQTFETGYSGIPALRAAPARGPARPPGTIRGRRTSARRHRLAHWRQALARADRVGARRSRSRGGPRPLVPREHAAVRSGLRAYARIPRRGAARSRRRRRREARRLNSWPFLPSTATTTGRARSPSSPGAQSEPLEATSTRERISKRPWNCSPGSDLRSKPRTPGSRSRARSPRTRRPQR